MVNFEIVSGICNPEGGKIDRIGHNDMKYTNNMNPWDCVGHCTTHPGCTAF